MEQDVGNSLETGGGCQEDCGKIPDFPSSPTGETRGGGSAGDNFKEEKSKACLPPLDNETDETNTLIAALKEAQRQWKTNISTSRRHFPSWQNWESPQTCICPCWRRRTKKNKLKAAVTKVKEPESDGFSSGSKRKPPSWRRGRKSRVVSWT